MAPRIDSMEELLPLQSTQSGRQRLGLADIATLAAEQKLSSSLPDEACPKVLKLAAGLLGVEPAERLDAWPAAWLAFRDAAVQGDIDMDVAGIPIPGELQPWQQAVLQRLRNLVGPPDGAATQAATFVPSAAGVNSTNRCGTTDGDTSVSLADGLNRRGDKNPDFAEHVEVAEHLLRRVLQCVSLLQGFDNGRAIILREYNEWVVPEVCSKLASWLEQVATMVSVYHIHLLDLENERRRLRQQCEAQAQQLVEAEQKRREAELRHARAVEFLRDDQCMRKAHEMLGKGLPKHKQIVMYTQEEVDAKRKEWEMQELAPVSQELVILREAHATMLEAMTKRKKAADKEMAEQAAAAGAVPGSVSPTSRSELEEEQEHSRATTVRQSAEIAAEDRGRLQEEKDVRRSGASSAVGLAHSERDSFLEAAPQLLDAVASELQTLLERAEAANPHEGAGSWRKLVAWAQTTVKGVASRLLPARKVSSLLSLSPPASPPEGRDEPDISDCSPSPSSVASFADAGGVGRSAGEGGRSSDVEGNQTLEGLGTEKRAKGQVDWHAWLLEPPPAWELDAEFEQRPARLESDAEIEARVRAEYQKRMKICEADMEAQVKAAQADAAAAKEQAKETLLKMQAETRRADEACKEAGLTKFMKSSGRQVYERLYLDATARISNLADRQLKHLEETNKTFMQRSRSMLRAVIQLAHPENENDGLRDSLSVDGTSVFTRSPTHPAGQRLVGGDDEDYSHVEHAKARETLTGPARTGPARTGPARTGSSSHLVAAAAAAADEELVGSVPKQHGRPSPNTSVQTYSSSSFSSDLMAQRGPPMVPPEAQAYQASALQRQSARPTSRGGARPRKNSRGPMALSDLAEHQWHFVEEDAGRRVQSDSPAGSPKSIRRMRTDSPQSFPRASLPPPADAAPAPRRGGGAERHNAYAFRRGDSSQDLGLSIRGEVAMVRGDGAVARGDGNLHRGDHAASSSLDRSVVFADSPVIRGDFGLPLATQGEPTSSYSRTASAELSSISRDMLAGSAAGRKSRGGLCSPRSAASLQSSISAALVHASTGSDSSGSGGGVPAASAANSSKQVSFGNSQVYTGVPPSRDLRQERKDSRRLPSSRELVAPRMATYPPPNQETLRPATTPATTRRRAGSALLPENCGHLPDATASPAMILMEPLDDEARPRSAQWTAFRSRIAKQSALRPELLPRPVTTDGGRSGHRPKPIRQAGYYRGGQASNSQSMPMLALGTL